MGLWDWNDGGRLNILGSASTGHRGKEVGSLDPRACMLGSLAA